MEREVEALRARGRDDVRGVADEVQAAVAHRLGDVAPHSRHAFLEHRPFRERPAVEPEPKLQLLPDAVVGPFGEILVGATLDVEPAQLGIAQAQEREAARRVRVHELVVRRCNGREDPEPAEGIVARALAQDAGRNARTADPVVPVTARNDIALELVVGPFVTEADLRPGRLELVNADAGDLEEQRQAGVEPRGDEIFHDLGLPVDHDRPPAGQLAQRDAMALAVELELDPVVDDPLPLHALPHARLHEQIGRTLLEHAGADPVLDVIATPVFEYDGLDAL